MSIAKMAGYGDLGRKSIGSLSEIKGVSRSDALGKYVEGKVIDRLELQKALDAVSQVLQNIDNYIDKYTKTPQSEHISSIVQAVDLLKKHKAISEKKIFGIVQKLCVAWYKAYTSKRRPNGFDQLISFAENNKITIDLIRGTDKVGR